MTTTEPVNGYDVTVMNKRASGTSAVTVTPPRNLRGDIEVEITTVSESETVDVVIEAEDGPVQEPARFSLGTQDEARTVVNIKVTSNGNTLSPKELARVLAKDQKEGLEICLPVSPALLEEAERLDRRLELLHKQGDVWTAVAKYDPENPGMICATLTDFSRYAVGYEDERVAFAKDVGQPTYVFRTGTAVSEKLPAVVSGDEPITYMLTDKDGNVAKLPAGLIYKLPGDKVGDDGTMTGTPTTPTDQQDYTLTATDEDGETATFKFSIKVKPGIESRDLGLVLAGVGRTLATDAVEILGNRFGPPASRLQITLGGQVLRLTAPAASSPPSPSSSSPTPSPLAGEGRGEGGLLRGEGGVLRGEGSLLQSEAQESAARPAGGPSPWQRATGLAIGVARALGVAINTPPPHSPSPLAGEGQGEGGLLRGEGSIMASTPTDTFRGPRDWQSPFRIQPVSGRDLLARSAFELPLTRTGEDGVPSWILWGRGSASGFSGQPEEGFKMDGRLYSGYVGLDYRRDSLLMGLAVAHSTGDVNYERTGGSKAGADVELTSVLPYVHWQPRPGLGVWSLLGAGWGEMDLKLVGDTQTRSTRLTSWLGAVGGRQALTTWQGIDLAAKTDAFLTTVRAAGTTEVPEAQGHAQRMRLLVEGRTAVDVSSVSRLEPRLELGGRWDNGTRGAGPRRRNWAAGWRIRGRIGVERRRAGAVSAAARGRGV